MSKWIKVNAYARMDQAMLGKDLLVKNDIDAVIVKEQDSAFLLGEIEVYVKEEEAEAARELLQEFEGWTRVNVFSRQTPVERLKAILEDNDFQTFLMRKQDEDNNLTNYELYVPNKQGKKAKKLLENLMGWATVMYLQKAQQAAIRIDILEENGIPTLAVKDRDKQGRVKGVKIFVDESLEKEALGLLDAHKGWELLQTYKKESVYQKHLHLLETNSIPVWEDQAEGSLALYVPTNQKKKASEIINIHTHWVTVKSYNSVAQANLDKEYLENNHIEAFIINQRDSVFLLGTINLYVNESYLEEAKQLLENQS